MKMKRYRLLFFLLIMLSLPALLKAQAPFKLDVEKGETRQVRVGQFTEFKIDITNTSAEDIYVRGIRIRQEMPDTSWYSSICTAIECYDKSVDTLPQLFIGEGGYTYVLVHVFTKSIAGSGRVVMQFDWGIGSTPVTQEVEVTASFPGGVDPLDQAALRLDAYPNPTATSAMIPLPAPVARAAASRLELFDARGERVADLTDDARRALDAGLNGLHVDVSALPVGHYRYRLLRDGVLYGGSLVVVR